MFSTDKYYPHIFVKSLSSELVEWENKPLNGSGNI